jgi:hypothetical protein
MTGNLEKLSREFARALDQTIATVIQDPEMASNVVVSMFDDIESLFLSKVEKQPHLVTEVKRGVAERKLDALCGRDFPFERIMALQENIRRLGYENMDRESTREIMFARYCLEYARPDKAKEAMEKLCIRLDATLKTQNWKRHRDSRKIAAEILSSIG